MTIVRLVLPAIAASSILAACSLGALDGLAGPDEEPLVTDAASVDSAVVKDPEKDAATAADAPVDVAPLDAGFDACKKDGPRSPRNGQNLGGNGGVSWTGYQDIVFSDDLRASVTLQASGPAMNSEFVVGGDFGFVVPAAAKVRGIEISVERVASSPQSAADLGIRIIKPTLGMSDSFRVAPGTWPVAPDAIATYGSSTDTWGFTLTGADVASPAFAVAVSARSVAPQAVTVFVDHIEATIHYCE